MQVWTIVSGNTAPIASGKPLRPSTTAIRMSLTPRVFRSFITLSQNFGALGLLDPQAQHVLLALGVQRQGDVDGLVLDQAFVADLHPQRVEKDDRIAARRAAGSASP